MGAEADPGSRLTSWLFIIPKRFDPGVETQIHLVVYAGLPFYRFSTIKIRPRGLHVYARKLTISLQNVHINKKKGKCLVTRGLALCSIKPFQFSEVEPVYTQVIPYTLGFTKNISWARPNVIFINLHYYSIHERLTQVNSNTIKRPLPLTNEYSTFVTVCGYKNTQTQTLMRDLKFSPANVRGSMNSNTTMTL